jgi:hypothetical protein
MKTIYWEGVKIYTIQRDIQLMIDSKELKTVVSLVMTSIVDPKAASALQSAILIYK